MLIVLYSTFDSAIFLRLLLRFFAYGATTSLVGEQRFIYKISRGINAFSTDRGTSTRVMVLNFGKYWVSRLMLGFGAWARHKNSVSGRLNFNKNSWILTHLKINQIQYHIVKVYITEDRARDLVYVHSNLSLLEDIQAVKYVGTAVEWDNPNNGLLLILPPSITLIWVWLVAVECFLWLWFCEAVWS